MADYMAGWLRFFVWCVAGACFALGISALGVFTVPVGALLAVGLRKVRGSDRELLGLLEGVGVVIADELTAAKPAVRRNLFEPPGLIESQKQHATRPGLGSRP